MSLKEAGASLFDGERQSRCYTRAAGCFRPRPTVNTGLATSNTEHLVNRGLKSTFQGVTHATLTPKSNNWESSVFQKADLDWKSLKCARGANNGDSRKEGRRLIVEGLRHGASRALTQ